MEKVEETLNDVSQMVESITRLGEDISRILQQGRKPQGGMLEIIADTMEMVAEVTGLETIGSQEWKEVYHLLRNHEVANDFVDRLIEWEDEVCLWCESVETAIRMCNMCHQKIIYQLERKSIRKRQKEAGFPYWNAIFESSGRQNKTCPKCQAEDWERMAVLFLEMLGSEEGERIKVLQIEPTVAMSRWLSQKENVILESLYFSEGGWANNLGKLEEETYDVILCAHVLERAVDDRKIMREICRILKKDGVCLFAAPILVGLNNTIEQLGLSQSENLRCFGWENHVRLYGKKDFLDRLMQEGYLVHILDEAYFGAEVWNQAGLTDIHCLYAATREEIGIGVEPYKAEEIISELVSVIIPIYNQAYGIERAVRNVLNQTWEKVEIIVVDDASTDDIAQVIPNLQDSRVRYLRLEENAGTNHARNMGIRAARGNYIAFYDINGEWLSDKLEKQMKELKLYEQTRGDKVGAVYCVTTKYKGDRVWKIEPQIEDLGENAAGDIYRCMQGTSFISTASVLIRKNILEEVGCFEEAQPDLQDWEFLLRIAQKYEFFPVQESLVKVYVQENNIPDWDKAWINTALYVIREHQLASYNRNAYNILIKNVISMLKNPAMDREYTVSVIAQIKDHGVLTKREIRKIEEESGVEQRDSRSVFKELLRMMQEISKNLEHQKKLIQNLYANYNVQKGWKREINKEKLDYLMELDHSMGVTGLQRNPEIIISLTSYPDRMYDIKYTLYSLLHQSLKPDRVILWLAEEQFPNREGDIGKSILNLRENGLTIMWCEDLKSYKKLVPALEKFSEDILVTADDDIYYPENWLELLYNSYLQAPDCIHCHRGHKVKLNGDHFAAYSEWQYETDIKYPTYYVFPTGCGGVLYPPKVLYKDAAERKLFLELAPNGDDVWFWTMSVLNHTKSKIVENGIKEIIPINWAREIGLCEETTLAMKNTGVLAENDTWLDNVLKRYAEVPGIVSADREPGGLGWQGSAHYWESRYATGGTSGAGSYHQLAAFKAKIINQFVQEKDINFIIEWGCGDENQLKLAKYPRYVGFDVSAEAVKRCKDLFKLDNTKSFIWSGAEDFTNEIKGDLSLSLDVIYHLIEDDVFELYMNRLFESSQKYVCIYSCNFEKRHAQHVRCRKFTDYIEKKLPDWKLIQIIKNEYPYDEKNPNDTSWSDFYFYEKCR